MSNKLEQMNVRLSESLKKKIIALAEEKDLKTSDFVRQTLEEAIEGGSVEDTKDKLLKNFQSGQRQILQAAAFIAHTDTGRSLVDCLKTALEIAENQKITEIADIDKLTREEREEITLQVNDLVAQKLGISALALTFVRLMLTTYIGVLYNQEIFQMTPLSMKTMDEIKQNLDKEKANKKT